MAYLIKCKQFKQENLGLSGKNAELFDSMSKIKTAKMSDEDRKQLFDIVLGFTDRLRNLDALTYVLVVLLEA